MLVLALIAGAAADKKEKEDTCKNLCAEKKLKEPACKESCALNKRFKKVWIEAVQCSLKCNKKHGFGTPDSKSCEEGCKKKYEDKVAEITASCHTVCTKVEKEQLAIEECKKICTPSLIFKEIKEALH